MFVNSWACSASISIGFDPVLEGVVIIIIIIIKTIIIIIIIIIKPHFIVPYEHLKVLYKVKTQKSYFKNTLKTDVKIPFWDSYYIFWHFILNIFV